MALKDLNEGSKTARGKPFEKGNQFFKKRKNRDEDILDRGLESNTKRGNVRAALPQKNDPIKSEKNKKEEPVKIMEEEAKIAVTEKEEDEKKSEIIETIDFINGTNKIALQLSKKHNRMFQIKIILNDQIEVRPMTYTGATTGYSFWNLLKGSLKK